MPSWLRSFSFQNKRANVVREPDLSHDGRSAHYAALDNHDLDKLLFTEPLSEDGRKAKRNLIAAGFAAILIASLGVQVDGFLGLKAGADEAIGADLTRGLACLTVLYFAAGYLISIYIDLSAWMFEHERANVSPYLELLKRYEFSFHASAEGFDAIRLRFDDELGRFTPKEATDMAAPRFEALQNQQKVLHGEMEPLLRRWERAAKRAQGFARRRTVVRVVLVGIWDYILPVAIATYGIYRTSADLGLVFRRVL